VQGGLQAVGAFKGAVVREVCHAVTASVTRYNPGAAARAHAGASQPILEQRYGFEVTRLEALVEQVKIDVTAYLATQN
jgi:diaminopimelate decarboxylase